MTEPGGAEVPADDAGAGDRPPETLTTAARLAYLAVFEAITDGWNRKAARLLRDLDPAQLTELAVICGDVRTLAEAEQRRRGDPEPAAPEHFTAALAWHKASPRERQQIRDITGLTDVQLTELASEHDFAANAARFDASPREQRRIAGITDLIDAEDIIYGQATAALERGDRDTAVELLRWCARAGIGESAWLLAEALEAAGEHAEADTWYARAAADGDERAAITIQINAGSLGTPAARRIRARADKDAVAEVLRRAREHEEPGEGEQ